VYFIDRYALRALLGFERFDLVDRAGNRASLFLLGACFAGGGLGLGQLETLGHAGPAAGQGVRFQRGFGGLLEFAFTAQPGGFGPIGFWSFGNGGCRSFAGFFGVPAA
jgi:hypothetical protein